MAEKDHDAPELDEAEEVLRMILVPRDQAADVLQPREPPLDDPAGVWHR